jgi:hypothetical protein
LHTEIELRARDFDVNPAKLIYSAIYTFTHKGRYAGVRILPLYANIPESAI